MNIKKVIVIVIPIIILIIAIPIFINSVSNLQQINQDKENSKPLFISQLEQVLGDCSKMTGVGLENCKQTIPLLQQQCSFYGNPSICTDPRINEIMSSQAQTMVAQPSINFTTYTNNQFGFSISYPSNWFVHNFPDGSIGISDKMTGGPNVLVEIKSMQSTGSLDNIASTYVNQVGVPGYPVTLQSQVKIMIKDKEAYRIQYTQTIGNALCQSEDYVINGIQYVSIISFDNCDSNIFSHFLPTYESIVSTFK